MKPIVSEIFQLIDKCDDKLNVLTTPYQLMYRFITAIREVL